MKEVSYTNAKNNLKTYLDYVNDNQDTITVVRKNGGNVVLISEDDYNSINETLYLLSSANNRKHLRQAIKNQDDSESVNL